MHSICQPRVACTIVWQPWAIKSATPTALKHVFCNTIDGNMRINKRQKVPIVQWIYPLWWILPSGNAMGVMPVSQWMYLLPWMLLPRNSVRVVLLIAQGWRGTSLPRVSIRKGIQRRRCWAFSMKARLQRNLSWRINQKKLNTYGVVSHTTYVNPG